MATAPDAAAAAQARAGRNTMPYGCGCALVIVTALVVTVVLVIMQWIAGGRQAGHAEDQRPVPITGSAAVLSDGVTIVYSDPNGFCRMQGLTAAETAASVVLSLSESQGLVGMGCAGFGTAGHAGSPGGPAWGGGSPATATVTLTSPLGDRRLVDATYAYATLGTRDLVAIADSLR